ncbi:MAG: hypothetical protein CMJ75_03435 [Planctomycetaceae bacterium]|nr:hypothetical protein [Planctomycetaceae bacterium]
MARLELSATVLLLNFLFAVTSLRAEDYFLTVGGGYAPTGNQISLEKNVHFFQHLLDAKYPGSQVHHDIFFSDGDDPNRDLQYLDTEASLPRANLLLATIFRKTNYLNHRYRSHQVPGVVGATTRSNLADWFDEQGAQLKAGDRLLVYVTAHGGKSKDKKRPENTQLFLWNNQPIQMTEWTRHLDKVPAEVSVVVVMVQCYSGGFANVIFKEGDSSKGLAGPNRCGFYATVQTRPAAGCTPDINEENYQEYSSYFWAAILGATRTGQAVSSCDYNEDGVVSFAEAHAYALLTSATIDISVKTSDAFLRAYSRYPKSGSKAARRKGRRGERPPQPVVRLWHPDSAFEDLVDLARAEERVVLEGLSGQLELFESRRARQARSVASRLAKENKSRLADRNKMRGQYDKLAARIRREVINRWPELANPWHPSAAPIIQEEADAVVECVESHASYKRFSQLRQRLNRLSREQLDGDRKWAKCQRLIRALENVALAANLPHVASAGRQREYVRLLGAEMATLGANQ